jgi:hypothetical protein
MGTVKVPALALVASFGQPLRRRPDYGEIEGEIAKRMRGGSNKRAWAYDDDDPNEISDITLVFVGASGELYKNSQLVAELDRMAIGIVGDWQLMAKVRWTGRLWEDGLEITDAEIVDSWLISERGTGNHIPVPRHLWETIMRSAKIVQNLESSFITSARHMPKDIEASNKVARELVKIAKILISKDEWVVHYENWIDGIQSMAEARGVLLALDEDKEIADSDKKALIKRIKSRGFTITAGLPNALDGMTNVKARKTVYTLLSQYSKGFFHDEYWEPINAMWKALTGAGIDWSLTSADYDTNAQGTPAAKRWKFEVNFVNDNGRPTILRGQVVASGGGSVSNPLERYDLVVMVY